jgi:hypothetical protein
MAGMTFQGITEDFNCAKGNTDVLCVMSRYFNIKTTTTAVYMWRNGYLLHCTGRSGSRLIVEHAQ